MDISLFMKQEWIMYSVYAALLFLVIQTDGYKDQCTYAYSKNLEYVDYYNHTDYNISISNYCTLKDITDGVRFRLLLDKSAVQISFISPKTECRYGIVLLVNTSIKDETECAEDKFQESVNIYSQVHTAEKTICVLTNTNQFITNNNSTISPYENNVMLWFQHIFTGCYAILFHIDKPEYIIRDYAFLNTTYKRMEVTEPQFTCKYNTYSNFEQSHEVGYFTIDITLSADTGLLLKMTLIPQYESHPSPFHFDELNQIHTWTIDLVNEQLNELNNCSLVQIVNGKYLKTIQCNVQMQIIKTTDYGFRIDLIDDRCNENTLWKPPINGIIPCRWIKRCTKTFQSLLDVEDVNIMKSNRSLNTSSYLLLPIIAIVLVVSAIIVILYFMHCLRIRNENVNIYVNPHQDAMNDSHSQLSNFNIVDSNDSEKIIDQDKIMCNDIVLLYTKGSTPFMALMEDFREILSKICSCSVHDWHDGIEWNNVAKFGAVLWFTKLFKSGCRVVWIDIPTTRSVISNSDKSNLNPHKFSKYYEIGDFRDVAFPAVLELAKHNMKGIVSQYRRHFVVRFEGLKSPQNMNDPFLDLSPHTRYLMPQHLKQLCAHLSSVKPVISKYEINTKEDLLQHHLKFMKIDPLM